MPRSTGSLTIMFGMVAIPCKLYTASFAEKVSFHLLNPATNNRLKQQYIDAITGELVIQVEANKGFEIAKDQCVVFTKDELKSLESERTNTIDVLEFVPADSIDLLEVEKTYYLGPDKGADKSYTLLSFAILAEKMVAVGRWSSRGKDELVIIRPYKNGLILHQMFYNNEVRSFDEIIDSVAKIQLADKEKGLAKKLIAQLSEDTFDSSKYKDEYAARVLDVAQKKLAGEGFVMQNLPKVEVKDLFAALEASIEAAMKPKKSTKKKKA